MLSFLVMVQLAALGGAASAFSVSQSHDHAPPDSVASGGAMLLCSSERILRLGVDLEQQGSWALAAAAYLAGTRCFGPLQCYCRVGLGRCLLALGRSAEVPLLLIEARLPASLRAPAALLRAQAMLNQGACDAALLELGSIEQLAPPLRSEAAVAEALSWLGLGAPDSAREVLLRSLRGELSGPWAGRACRLLEALAAGPDSVSLLDFCAGVRERRGELDRAAAHWRIRARTGEGRDVPTAQLSLARVLRSQRRTAEARAIMHDLLSGPRRREVECRALLELAACALREGGDEEIAATHGDYAQHCPEGELVGEALWQRARAMERMGNFDGARELYQALGRSEAADFGEECLFRQALCCYVQGDYSRAAGLLDSLSLVSPGPRNCHWLGKALERLGAVARAESCFAAAARMGDRPSYYSVRAGSRLMLGGNTVPFPEWHRSGDHPLATAVSASVRDGEYGPVRWSRIRPHLERADLLLRAGLGRYAADECEWAVRRSERHPVVRALVIGMLQRGMAYPQSMQAAYQWWREDMLPGLLEYLYPRAYRGTVGRVCRDLGVDSCLVWAVMREESWFDPLAVSPAGAVGLMQLMPHTARYVSETRRWPLVPDLRDPDSNIRLGAAHLSDLLREFPFVEAALAAYNAGRGPARRWLGLARVRDRDTFVESITYGETRAYVQRVVASYAFYRSGPSGRGSAQRAG